MSAQQEETTGLLATPDEEMKVAIQMQQVKDYTVRPGLMRLPVKTVDSAKNAEQYVLRLEHPFLDEADTRFHIDKPAYWDPTVFEWPKILDWYGYGPGNQYHIQTDRMYVKYDHEADEWTLTKPPSEWNRTWYRTKKQLKNGPWWVSHPVRFASTVNARTIGRMRNATPGATLGTILGGSTLAFLATLLWTLTGNFGHTVSASMGAIGTSIVASVIMFALLAIALQPPEEGR